MKKTLALALALVMLLSLCACGSTPAAESTPAPAAEPAELVVSDETAAVMSTWADDLYEPETSITYPATIVWPAEANAQDVAGQAVRPNTMIVAIDEALSVSTLGGEKIADNLADYLAAVKGTTIAALYISTQETADAFNAFSQKYAVADVLVVASYENTAFVKQICDANAGILGVVDWSASNVGTDRASLNNITTTTNAAHAKVAIVPENITGCYDAVEYLRAMLTTVWAVTSADEVSVYTALTNGVNGIVCEDYNAVVDAIESVNDVTTLMRHVFITGHRGLPSQYIENTIRSERAAIEAGANVLECDISMSSDGVIFVLHDDDAKRLFNYYEVDNIEELTIAEIQALQYDMTDYGVPGEDADDITKNSVLNANNTNRTTAGRENTTLTYDPTVDHIPTLVEYLDALDDENIFHFIEIKSYNPGIVPEFRRVCEEMNITNRMCVITFNDGGNGFYYEYDESADVMKAMAEEWPEMSLGYLGFSMYSWSDLDAVRDEQGIGAAVGTLYSYLQPYNSTYHDYNAMMYSDVVFAARHRGLTSWAWTYNDEALFAHDYLLGGTYSMTSNFSTWATDFPVRISASNQTVLADGSVLKCIVTAQDGSVLSNVEGLSLVTVSGVEVSMDENYVITGSEAGEAVVMVRLDTTLDVNGADVSETVDPNYAIYSNPFVITVG